MYLQRLYYIQPSLKVKVMEIISYILIISSDYQKSAS